MAKEKKRGTRRRKPTKEEEQGEKKIFKNIFLQFLPFEVAHVNSYSERCKTNRAEQHQLPQSLLRN